MTLGMACRWPRENGLCERFDDVQIERFARGSGFLGLLDHGDGAAGQRQRGEEMRR